MRIIYLHQYFNTPAMPGGTRSYEMAKRFVAEGHQVRLITSDREGKGGGRWRHEDVDGIDVYWYPQKYSNSMSYSNRLWAFVRFAVAAGRKAVRLGGDVVFASSTPLTICIPGALSSRRLGIPMVFEVRDLWPEMPIAVGALRNPIAQKLARRLERFAYQNAQQIVALSPGMADGIVQTGYPRERISVIPNSCDIELFGRMGPDENNFLNRYPFLKGRKLITYTGALGRINGVSYLAEIAAAMKQIDPMVAFVVVGDGQERAIIEERARHLGVLEDSFWLLPPVSKSEVPAIFDAASLTCSLVIDLPAAWNNSANKFFDSLASGTPIAINYEGWQADLIRKEGIGVVIPPADPAASARGIAEYLRSEELQHGARNARRLADRFSRDRLAQRTLDVLRAATRGETALSLRRQ